MGKRRDRRQQQASGRRVKLDLSMEDVLPPSEAPGSLEVLDSALGQEVKAGAKNQEAANENPLSLLGQYSDDEADEFDDFTAAGSLQDNDNEERKDSLKYQDEQEMAESQVLGKVSLKEKESTSTLVIGTDDQEAKDFLISDVRLQDASKEQEWQPVLDDSSGEYYYWNVQTGETTWVKPVEDGTADELQSCAIQPVDINPLLGISQEQSRVEMDTENDQRESCGEGKSPACESYSIQDPERAITCLESMQSELGLASGKNDLAGDASTAAEKIEDIEDPESTAGSIGFLQGKSDHGKEVLKEEESEKDEEESLPTIKEDIKLEAAYDIQGASEKNLQQRSSPLTERFLEGTVIGQVTFEDVQDASGCTRNLMLTKEAQRTFEDKMASLVERGESLHHRMNVLARESCGGVSRHALMASQTEARLTDWKAFCALGFVRDACLSFIQEEMTKLELVLTAEECNELERQKLVDSASSLDASRVLRPEIKNSDWSLNWGYYQQDNIAIPELWKQGQSTEITGNIDDVEEGEIQTSYAESHPTYAGIPEGTTAVNAPKLNNDIGTEDVDMDVDMEVDDDVEAEPAVPGMSSDVPASDIPVPYSYPYPMPGSNEMSTLAPLDSTCVGEPYFHTGISGDSWAPPLPPEEEWAPPPPGESEAAPPPPPDELPPLPPQSPEVVETFSSPLMSSEVQLQYFVPDYTVENNSLPQSVFAADYPSVIDSSIYGAFVEGAVYSNCSQPIDTFKIEQPYVVTSGSTQDFNGWTAPVLAPTASLSVNPMSSEAPVKSSTYAPPSQPTAPSTADSNTAGETKKLGKGKIKKRTHAVAAAPMLNKKVSSLVNKWKQAKEELHGGEDEDEDEDKALYDVEVLEKKRQKEIEEWRRQQIASGDALDNANFQPLGTLDWRERVKRARKADLKEGKEGTTGSVVPSSIVEGHNAEALKSQKPNMTDLSKGLPVGWQAYWDEASGEAYYGNLITQETTWDRPVT